MYKEELWEEQQCFSWVIVAWVANKIGRKHNESKEITSGVQLTSSN